MPTLTIAPGEEFTVINSGAIRYNGNIYQIDGPVTYPDDTEKTLAEILVENGATAYAFTELKRGFKVEGYDPDSNNLSWFSLYSSNLLQTGKNESERVPGGMWCSFVDFIGEQNADGTWNNHIVQMWETAGQSYDTRWIGFSLGYGVSETRAYVVTYQDDFLQESVPTPAVTIDCTFMHGARLHGIFRHSQPENGHYYLPIRRIRLWRSTVGSDGTTVYRLTPVDAISDGYNSEGVVLEFNHDPGKFTQQIPDITRSYGYVMIDTNRDEELLGNELESQEWDPPPFRGSLQLVNCWNGFMSAHHDNIVMFSEPYRPHAWPIKYRYALPYNVVSKEVDGNTLLVTTTGPAYLFMGAHPSAMSFDALKDTQAGVKSNVTVLSYSGLSTVTGPSRAITRTPNGVCYATVDGLVVTEGGRSRLLTEALFTKEEWQSRYGGLLGNMHLAYSNGKILAWFYRSPEYGFLVSLDGKTLTRWFPAQPLLSGAQLPGSDGVYLVAEAGGTTMHLQRFEHPTADRAGVQWLGKKHILSAPTNFGVVSVVGYTPAGATIVIRVYAGTRLVLNHTTALTEGEPFTKQLPAGFRERQWSIEFILGTNCIIREAYLAGSAEELRNA
jgi:hypothetical protein